MSGVSNAQVFWGGGEFSYGDGKNFPYEDTLFSGDLGNIDQTEDI
jgi:hypothetical protein